MELLLYPYVILSEVEGSRRSRIIIILRFAGFLGMPLNDVLGFILFKYVSVLFPYAKTYQQIDLSYFVLKSNPTKLPKYEKILKSVYF